MIALLNLFRSGSGYILINVSNFKNIYVIVSFVYNKQKTKSLLMMVQLNWEYSVMLPYFGT